MKLSKTAFNENKFKEDYEKFIKAKKLCERYLFDTDFVIEIVDLLEKNNHIVADKNNSEIYNQSTETYQPQFAMFIWREIVLPNMNYSFDEYQTMNEVVKSLEKIKNII
jgi:predicted lipoprotein